MGKHNLKETDANAMKASDIQPAPNNLSTVLVVGGGIAGLQAALDLDDLGLGCVVLDSASSPGGLLARLDKLFPTNDCADCVLSSRVNEAATRPGIRIWTNAEIDAFSGTSGSFSVSVIHGPEEGLRSKETLDVQAVILAPGCVPFDAALKPEYGYGRMPNVVTSVDLEEWIRPGESSGRGLLRPSDGATPQRIAFLQCVGSRDTRCGNPYCSSVCCAYAVKEAVAVKELLPDAEVRIYFMDVRAHEKDLDPYFEKARRDHGVEFAYGRIPAIEEAPETGSLRFCFESEDGARQEREVDLAVLSVGLQPSVEARRTAEVLGVDLNPYGFASTDPLDSVWTSRPGIYVAGAFESPKDVAESLSQASAAAACCARTLLEDATAPKRLPNTTVNDGPPRVGVFLCGCGGNVGNVIDLSSLETRCASLPLVAHTERTSYACSDAALASMMSAVRTHDLNRLVIASCSERILGPLFKNRLEAAGFPPRFMAMANLREQCAWVHRDAPHAALGKARSLVNEALASVTAGAPPEIKSIPFRKEVLVVGGGAAGLCVSLELCRMRVPVVLVERTETFGGNARRMAALWNGTPVPPFMEGLLAEARTEPLLTMMNRTRPLRTRGRGGAFITELEGPEGARSVLEHGAVVVATGAEEIRPSLYGYGSHPGVLTHGEMDEQLRLGAEALNDVSRAVFIQCVGSRDSDRPYCSRVCCTHSIQSALFLKKLRPQASIFILHRDIRTYGFREELYREAREAGILFSRFSPERKPRVEIRGGRVYVVFFDELLNADIETPADRLVLASAMVPGDSGEWLKELGVARDDSGFISDARMPLLSEETAVFGVFAAGLVQSPKSLEETVRQAKSAALRAALFLKDLGRERVSAVVDAGRCQACLACVRVCPYGAPAVRDGNVSRIDPFLCRACGVCVAECPAGAITLSDPPDSAMSARIAALLDVTPSP